MLKRDYCLSFPKRLNLSRDVILFVDDVLNSISKIEKYIEGFDYNSFLKDIKTQDAVVRNLEIIGEAVKNISKYYKFDESIVPWRKIIALRNILAHEYFGINENIIWDVCVNKLSVIKKECEKLIENS